MAEDSSTPKSAPDPHHPSEPSMPEGNARRWAVLAFFGFGLLVWFVWAVLFLL